MRFAWLAAVNSREVFGATSYTCWQRLFRQYRSLDQRKNETKPGKV
jgi:hypothetical protein